MIVQVVIPSLIICILFQLLPEKELYRFRFDREAILHGEYIRLISGHWVHMNWRHLFVNMFGLSMISLVFKNSVLTKYYWPISFMICLFISCMLLLTQKINWYMGYSGVLCGLFVLGICTDKSIPTSGRVLLFAVIAAKLLYEQTFGPLPGSVDLCGGPVIVESHLFGSIAGLLLAGILFVKNIKKGSSMSLTFFPARRFPSKKRRHSINFHRLFSFQGGLEKICWVRLLAWGQIRVAS